MPCSEIFLSSDGIFQRSVDCNKKNFVANHGKLLTFDMVDFW